MKNNYIQIYFKMDILLNIVKEKGIYDIIIDYKKWIKNLKEKSAKFLLRKVIKRMQ